MVQYADYNYERTVKNGDTMRLAIFILVNILCMLAGLMLMDVKGCEHTGMVICATSAIVCIVVHILCNDDI